MRYFDDQTDVDDWPDPLGYERFWQEVSTFDLDIPSREDCDADIAAGIVVEAMALRVLKGFARLQVIRQQNLPVRITAPWMALHQRPPGPEKRTQPQAPSRGISVIGP